MRRYWPQIIGAIIGAAIGLGGLIVMPMGRNYAECGTVFLCANQR